MPPKKKRTLTRQTPYVLEGPDDRLVRPWEEVKRKLQKWLTKQLRTEEQIKDAIETIRGKKDIVELAKRLKYFFGPKTINYGVREVTNQRTDAAKVVIKCFCIETRGREEVLFIVHGVAKGGIRVISMSVLVPIEDSKDREFQPGHEGEIDSDLNIMICSKMAGFILGYCKKESSLLFYSFEKCDTLVASYQMPETVYAMKYSNDFGHLFLACRGHVKRFMLSCSKSGGYSIALVPMANLASPMSAHDVCVGMRIDELECHINLICERDVYNSDFEENKPLSRYTCLHGDGQAKVTCMVVLVKHNWLITGANDGSVVTWDFATMNEVTKMHHNETHPVTSLAVTQSRAVSLLVMGFSNGVVLLWRLDYLKIAQRIEMPSPVMGLGWMTNNDFYVICTCGIFVEDVRNIFIMYSYTRGEFPTITRVQNHDRVAPEVLVTNLEGETFTLSCVRGVVTSETEPLLKPWPESGLHFKVFLEQSHEAIFQLYPDGSIVAFNRTNFNGVPLCRYKTPDIVIMPKKNSKDSKKSKNKDSKDSSGDGDDEDEDEGEDDDTLSDDDNYWRDSDKSEKPTIIPMLVNGLVHASMNFFSGGQAKNEKEVMTQLMNTVHGAGPLDEMPVAVSNNDDMVVFAGMSDGKIVLADAINYVMDEDVQAHEEEISNLFVSKRNKKLDDAMMTHFDHLVSIGTNVKDGPRAAKVWKVFYNLVKVVAPPHLKGRAAERYLRRGPKFLRQIEMEVLLEINLGSVSPRETVMIGNIFAFTLEGMQTICMYALQSPGNPGELISFLGGRAVDAHLSEPTCLDSNQWLMLFVSTAPGGNVKIWNDRNILLRNIYFEQDLLFGAGFISRKGDLLVSYDQILLCIPCEAYLTPFVVEAMLEDESNFDLDDVSCNPLHVLKFKSAPKPKTFDDIPTVLVSSAERKKQEMEQDTDMKVVTSTHGGREYVEGSGLQLNLEKKKKVKEEIAEEGEVGPFGYVYKRVVVDPEKSWIDGLSAVRDHFLDIVHKLLKRMTRDNRRALKHYDACIMKALDYLDQKLMYPHHTSIDDHFYIPTPDYVINKPMLDKLQNEVEDEEKLYTKKTTIPPKVEQRLKNLRALAIAPDGDVETELKARLQLSTIRAELGSLRYPATFRDHILGKWTQLTPEEIEEIMAVLMAEHYELQRRKREELQGGAVGETLKDGTAIESENTNKNSSQSKPKNRNKSRNRKGKEKPDAKRNKKKTAQPVSRSASKAKSSLIWEDPSMKFDEKHVAEFMQEVATNKDFFRFRRFGQSPTRLPPLDKI